MSRSCLWLGKLAYHISYTYTLAWTGMGNWTMGIDITAIYKGSKSEQCHLPNTPTNRVQAQLGTGPLGFESVGN